MKVTNRFSTVRQSLHILKRPRMIGYMARSRPLNCGVVFSGQPVESAPQGGAEPHQQSVDVGSGHAIRDKQGCVGDEEPVTVGPLPVLSGRVGVPGAGLVLACRYGEAPPKGTWVKRHESFRRVRVWTAAVSP